MVGTGQGCQIWYKIGKMRELISAGDVVVCRYSLVRLTTKSESTIGQRMTSLAGKWARGPT
jgi:hypothetical protein